MSSNNQDNNNGQGPWGSRKKSDEPSSSQNNPWDNGGKPSHGGGGNDGPDLDELLRRAQNRFQQGFDGGSGKGIGLGILIAGLIWASTGFYRVQPEENAVILTFGKLTNTRTESGLGYRLPWPVQQVEKVNVTFERRIEIGFRDLAPARSKSANTDLTSESMMLTGDENIIDIDFVVLWRVSDAGKYLFQIRDPETTVKKAGESAMREIIGRTPIQKALTEGRGGIEAKTKELMQQMMDDYQSGIVINDVQLQQVNPPAQVVDAFDDVQRARTDKERMRNEADAYRNDIIPKARGEAQKLIQESEGYKEATISKAKGDADRFLSVHKAYASSKDVTTKRIYIETMQQVLENSKKFIIEDSAKGAGVLPYLPLGQDRKGAGQ